MFPVERIEAMAVIETMAVVLYVRAKIIGGISSTKLGKQHIIH